MTPYHKLGSHSDDVSGLETVKVSENSYLDMIKRNLWIKSTTFIWCPTWKKALMPYANTEGPGERAHPCSQFLAFSVGRHIL